MKKAIIYTRVSTEEQVDGNSLDFQARQLRSICEREGTQIVKVFVEPGVSAKNADNRPELMAALKLAKRELGQGDFFMTYDVSRFTRNHYDGVGMMIQLQNKGVCFRDSTRIYSDSPEDRFLFILNSGLAQFENEVKARATRDRMAALAKSGEWQHSAPFGYRKGDKKLGEKCLVEVPDKAAVIRFVFESLRRGEKPADVAYKLEDFPAYSAQAYSKKGNRDLKFVLRVATNLLYAARQNTKLTGGTVKGNWEPLVSEELFDSVQNLMEGKPRVSTPKADQFWLKPVLSCGSCGNKLTGESQKKGKHHYYRCFGCRREAIPMEKAHQQLLAELDKLQFSEDVVEAIKQKLSASVSEEIKASETRRRELQRTIDKDNTILEALEDELLMSNNPGLDRGRLMERAVKTQTSISRNTYALSVIDSDEGLSVEQAFIVLDRLLSRLQDAFGEIPDVDKAAFVFVLLPQKVICKDKQLQTTESLVPVSLLGTELPPSPAWHPLR